MDHLPVGEVEGVVIYCEGPGVVNAVVRAGSARREVLGRHTRGRTGA